MTKLLSLLSLAWAVHASAQVALDKPIPVGPNDTVFRSTADPNGAYLMPTTLIVQDTPRISEINGEYRVFFNVGANPQQVAEITAKVPGLRMMRGWNAVIDAMGSTEADPRFHSRLIPLGDAGSLGAPLPYMFSIRKIGPKFGKESKALLDVLFNSPDTAHHLGTLYYEFVANADGKTYYGRSAVGIFAPAVKLAPPGIAAPNAWHGNVKPFAATNAGVKEPARVILKDAETSCWDNLKMGQICLR